MKNIFILINLTVIILLFNIPRVYGQPLKQNYPVTRLTDRIYIVYAPAGKPSKENGGFRSNVTFILTGKGVVVIDPGTSVYVGRMVLEHIRALTSQPVVAVFNTHIHGDHWLGNQAFMDANPALTIYAHTKMIELANQGEGQHLIKRLNKMTDNAISGTRPVPPNKAVAHGDVITIGDVDFHIHHTGLAHTDNDIMIQITQERALLCGDLVRNGLVGGVNQSFIGSIAAVNQALSTNATLFIPGSGKAGDRSMVEQYRSLLVTLYRTVVKYFNAGLNDFEIKPKVIEMLSQYHSWGLFKENIGLLVNQIYLEIESDDFQ